MKYSLMKVLIILPNTTFSYVAFRHSCHCSYKILLSFCGSLHVTFCLALSLISFTYKCGHVLSYFCYFLMLEMDKINGKHAFIGKINEIYTYTVIFFLFCNLYSVDENVNLVIRKTDRVFSTLP